VAFVAIVAYAPSLGYGLVYDDDVIATSPLLSRPFDLLGVLRNEFYPEELRSAAVYRPLSQWSFLLNWRANEIVFGAGDFGFGFHLPNLLLHAAASLLLLGWLRALRLPTPMPAVAALLFAAHPIHVEAVANVFNRSEPMTLGFGLAFLIAHRRGRSVPAAILYLLAAWSKESGITFLGLAVAADFLLPDPDRPFRPRSLLGYAAVLGLWVALRAFALRHTAAETAFTDNPTVAATTLERIATAAAIQVDYLRLLAWPFRQSTDYSYAQREVVRSFLDPRVLAFLLLSAAAVASALFLRRRSPVVALSVAGYAILFSVASNFPFPIGTIQAERLAYAPSIFACLLAAAALRPARLPGLAMAVLLTAGLGALTLRQTRVWRNEATLFRDAVRTAPRSAKAHRNLGTQLVRGGDLDTAAEEYETSARIAPSYVRTWILLGNLRRRLGEMDAAADAWRTALEVDPRFSETRADLADALIDLGRREEAAAQARELFARDPLHPRLPAIQDRLARGANPQELHAARAALAEAKAALAAGNANAAIARTQELVAGPVLPRTERAEALNLLADAWEHLGKKPRAGIYREAAARLSGGPVRR